MNIYKEKITTYKEWLNLDDMMFKILILISLNDNKFTGDLSDICTGISLKPYSRARKRIRKAIDKLERKKYINSTLNGRTYTLSIIPQGTKIKATKYIIHTFFYAETRGVSNAKMIKVYLWYVPKSDILCTNSEIARELGCSVSVICTAKKILQHDFNAIIVQTIRKYIGGEFISLGHIVTINAWINT
jgi:hypothetical protein